MDLEQAMMSEEGFVHIDNLLRLQIIEMQSRKARNECPRCGKAINQDDFVDELSKKEFKVSCTCQSCQDEIFDDE